MLKDPYVFDMLTFTDEYSEHDVEIELIKHIEKFLLELGKVLHLWADNTTLLFPTAIFT